MDCNGKWHEKELDDIKPIPITPEILEKNGFERGEYSDWINLDDALVLEDGLDGKNAYWLLRGGALVCPLNFVHELQHCLTLLGINKKLEL